VIRAGVAGSPNYKLLTAAFGSNETVETTIVKVSPILPKLPKLIFRQLVIAAQLRGPFGDRIAHGFHSIHLQGPNLTGACEACYLSIEGGFCWRSHYLAGWVRSRRRRMLGFPDHCVQRSGGN
jgi:hypothetical protein